MPSDPLAPDSATLVRRHRLSVRLWHWINAATLIVMLMSGLMIFNAHPHPLLGPGTARTADTRMARKSATARATRDPARRVDLTIGTTGDFSARQPLGDSARSAGARRSRHGPRSRRITDLALARRWHLTFAWAFAAGDRRLSA